MQVKRIIANIPAADPAVVDRFYRDILGLDLAMDHGWIRTYAGPGKMTAQLSVGSQGGSDTPLPTLSIEVDDLAEALRRVEAAGVALEYGPVSEPWGVRRFYVRDPAGTLLNILQHE